MRIKHTDRPESLTVSIPASTLQRVRVLLLDPTTGKVRYGALARVVGRLLEKWIEDPTIIEKEHKNGR